MCVEVLLLISVHTLYLQIAILVRFPHVSIEVFPSAETLLEILIKKPRTNNIT